MSYAAKERTPFPYGQVAYPDFLSLKPGDYIIVKGENQVELKKDHSWWMGQVMSCNQEARDPSGHHVIQVVDVDDEKISWINVDEISHVLYGLDGLSNDWLLNGLSGCLGFLLTVKDWFCLSS